MEEVYERLWVGHQQDYYNLNSEQKKSWAIVQACKEPFHREALGYSGRAAPKESPEYLWAYRENRLILNMVDAENIEYIPVDMVKEALSFIDENYEKGKDIFIHCNQGQSRSPSIAFLYLYHYQDVFEGLNIEKALTQFKTMYSLHNPAGGIHQFILQSKELLN